MYTSSPYFLEAGRARQKIGRPRSRIPLEEFERVCQLHPTRAELAAYFGMSNSVITDYNRSRPRSRLTEWAADILIDLVGTRELGELHTVFRGLIRELNLGLESNEPNIRHCRMLIAVIQEFYALLLVGPCPDDIEFKDRLVADVEQAMLKHLDTPEIFDAFVKEEMVAFQVVRHSEAVEPNRTNQSPNSVTSQEISTNGGG